MSEAREFWIFKHWNRMTPQVYDYNPIGDFNDEKIHVREVLPDAVTHELDELRKDKERLEWMIKSNARMDKIYNFYYIVDHSDVGYQSPRGAIDAAMKAECEK